MFDGTEAVRKALSAVLRTDERFGTGHLTDILLGVETDKVRQWSHDDLPTFGVGKNLNRKEWGAVFRQMMGHDLVRPDPERHGALRMTHAARPILRGEATISLRRDSLKLAAKGVTVKAQVSEEDAPLLSALKAKRRALAEAQGGPAYIVFADRTLIEMAETRPQSMDEMARISGIGSAKLERYGAAFLEVIRGEAVPPSHPSRRRLSGRPQGQVYDRLAEAQLELARGADGTGKYLSCTATTLRHIAERRPGDLTELERMPGMGPQKAERFGAAFLDILAGA